MSFQPAGFRHLLSGTALSWDRAPPGALFLCVGEERGWSRAVPMRQDGAMNGKPPSAPRGWHSRGYLPHFDAPEIVQTVVFRLADSLPKHLANANEDMRVTAETLDDSLDSGRGECWLRRTDVAEIVEQAMLHFDGERYHLLAWCIMPNHVHAMLEMQAGFGLGNLVRSWKSFTARRANHVLARTGPFWSPDYFDRYIRNDRHYEAALAYIEHNPVKAGLVSATEDWPWSSARRR
jgi:REP element-mobilizing transposase RayT